MFKNKKILLIGGTGSIGQALLNEILIQEPAVVRIYSRDEYKQFKLAESYGSLKNVRYLIGDVRDKERLNRAMQDIDYVFNLAALKHVPSSEYNPFEAVKTNVIGTQNVIDCAIQNKVKKVIYTSSDKAVSPTNTMGATKLLAERLMSSASYSKGDTNTIFASVRFGNVMGSRGSVIPLFKKQIIDKRYITITDPEMTRFMMSKSQAVNLIIKACKSAAGGEVFVLKMPVIKLFDLAEVVIDLVCKNENINFEEIKIKTIGLRPGEKSYEELMSQYEAEKAKEIDEMYVISSLYSEKYEDSCENSKNVYSSQFQGVMSKDQLKKLIIDENLI